MSEDDYASLVGEDHPARLPKWQEFRKPVSVEFLAGVFRMSRDTVRRKLGDCPERGQKRYDFLEAASRLVSPRLEIAEVIATFRQGDLPPKLQAAFWDGMRKRQAWEREARDLWHSDDVIALFGEVFQQIKSSVQLFSDAVEREHALSDAQRELLLQLSDGLLREVHERLVEVSKTQRRGSQVEDQEGME